MSVEDFYRVFPTEADCIAWLEHARWKGKPICPYCTSDRTTAIHKEQRHHCNMCYTAFSITVNTIFHHTHLPLQTWFLAIVLILNAKKGIPARHLARELNVNKNSAWRITLRIREAMSNAEQRGLLHRIAEKVEDETL